LGLAFIITWLLIYKIGKISSASALCASLLSPIYCWFIIGDVNLLIACVIMMLLLLWRHKSNIQRLIRGEEN
jgi:glycerol-3-phosphate acyltransferase PlsY